MSVEINTVAELIRLVERGDPVAYLFFWGHRPRPDGTIGASCLSQWWPAAFTVDGLRYATAEHYMMWRKALLFDDGDTAERILGAEDPRQVKALGREIRGFDEQIWQEARFDIVVTGNLGKFGQHDELRGYLVGTGDRILVEASPLDQVWGIGLAADDVRAGRPDQWQGLNLLGFALMRVRTLLRDA